MSMGSFEGVGEAEKVVPATVELAPGWRGWPVLAGALWLAASVGLAWWHRDVPVVAGASAGAGAAAATGAGFSWAIIGELALVLYAYSLAVHKGEQRAVYLGLAFWSGELLWEMVNALIGHFFGAPLFGLRGQTAWHIYAGLNVEITLMFAMVPLVTFGLLSKDREARVWKVPNRLAVPVGLGLFCVLVEVLLNRAGALVWTWWFWRWPHVGVIAFAYCAPFVLLVWAYDRFTDVAKCRGLLVRFGAAALVCHLVLHTWLGWVRPAPS